MQNSVNLYLESQRRRVQWEPALLALTHELSAILDPEEAGQLLVRAGKQLAQELVLPACESLESMEVAINRHWTELGWGFVRFTEREDSLDVEHHCLHAAEGLREGLAALLCGAYQQWFLAMGAGDQLRLRRQEGEDDAVLLYRLQT